MPETQNSPHVLSYRDLSFLMHLQTPMPKRKLSTYTCLFGAQMFNVNTPRTSVKKWHRSGELLEFLEGAPDSASQFLMFSGSHFESAGADAPNRQRFGPCPPKASILWHLL